MQINSSVHFSSPTIILKFEPTFHYSWLIWIFWGYVTCTGNPKNKEIWSWIFLFSSPPQIIASKSRITESLTCGCRHIYYTTYLAAPGQRRGSWCIAGMQCHEHMKFTAVSPEISSGLAQQPVHTSVTCTLQFGTHVWIITLHRGKAYVVLLAKYDGKQLELENSDKSNQHVWESISLLIPVTYLLGWALGPGLSQTQRRQKRIHFWPPGRGQQWGCIQYAVRGVNMDRSSSAGWKLKSQKFNSQGIFVEGVVPGLVKLLSIFLWEEWEGVFKGQASYLQCTTF